MKSQNIGYYEKLDHLRFFAAFWVLLYHSQQFFGPHYPGYRMWGPTHNPLVAFLIEGHTGVALFFTLSGFIFTLIAYGKPMDTWGFYRNRLLRIYPLYLTVLLVAVVVNWGEFAWGDVWASVFSLSTNPKAISPRVALHLWTIAVEFQFYAVFPFVVRFFYRDGFKYMLGLVLLMLVIRTGLTGMAPKHNIFYLAFFTHVGRFDQFLIGCMAAVAYQRFHQHLRHWAWPPVALLGVITAVYGFHWAGGYGRNPYVWKWIIWSPVEATVWGALIVTYLSSSLAFPRRVSAALAWLGTLSYSLYINHWIVGFHHLPMLFHPQWLPDPRASAVLMGLVVVFPLTLGLSMITYWWIERPFMAMRQSYIRHPQTPDAVPPNLEETPAGR